ncbi:MAG: non-ribosomal peptide synthetase [Gemmatimonadaceae bacterium]
MLRIDASSSSQDAWRDSAAATRDIDSSKTQELALRHSTAETGSADQLCYVIYTSGSTGGPKGVLVTHRQLWHYVAGVRARLGLNEPDAAPLHYALVQPVTFDSVMTLFWLALGSGGTLHVISAEDAVRPESVAAYGHTHAIDVLKLTPSHLAMLLSGAREPLDILPRRCLILGGEGMQRTWASDVCRLVPPECTVFNHYGPTEATVGVLVHGLQPPEGLEADESTWTDPEREGGVPLGWPLPFARVYVLDRVGSGEPVPIGVTGELYLGGLQVARGYLNRAALTAERFVPDQFGPRGGRLYRTGDLARWRRDRAIEFLGRADFQVKVRGYRIEVGEIEAVLAAHPAVEQAIVLARPPTLGTTAASPGELQLVAYYIETPAATTDTETLRAYLGEQLPAYMLPAAYVRLGAFPLMSNGKVDRNALPAPDHSSYATGAYEAPVGDLEQTLSELWSEIVRVDRVGRWDDFFTLGGHSLSAVRVITYLRDRFDIDLPVRAIFTNSTVAALSREIERLIYADVAEMSEAEARQALARESR